MFNIPHNLSVFLPSSKSSLLKSFFSNNGAAYIYIFLRISGVFISSALFFLSTSVRLDWSGSCENELEITAASRKDYARIIGRVVSRWITLFVQSGRLASSLEYLARSRRKIKAADELALILVPFSFQAAEYAADPGGTRREEHFEK